MSFLPRFDNETPPLSQASQPASLLSDGSPTSERGVSESETRIANLLISQSCDSPAPPASSFRVARNFPSCGKLEAGSLWLRNGLGGAVSVDFRLVGFEMGI